MSDRSQIDARDLEALLDTLIPRSSDGKHPGAAELGIAVAIQQSAEGDAMLRATIEGVMEPLAVAARREGADCFADLDEGTRVELLQELVAASPELLPGLLPPVYTAYYQRPEVVRAIGIESWPPHPKGYELEAGDLTLLDPVRRRGDLYRRV